MISAFSPAALPWWFIAGLLMGHVLAFLEAIAFLNRLDGRPERERKQLRESAAREEVRMELSAYDSFYRRQVR